MSLCSSPGLGVKTGDVFDQNISETWAWYTFYTHLILSQEQFIKDANQERTRSGQQRKALHPGLCLTTTDVPPGQAPKNTRHRAAAAARQIFGHSLHVQGLLVKMLRTACLSGPREEPRYQYPR